MTIDPLKLARQLIDIPSTTDDERGVGEFLERQLTDLGFETRRHEVTADRFNLFASAGGRPRVVLNTHIDTVPPWFASYEDDQFVFGRGACDTKGILAAMLCLVYLVASPATAVMAALGILYGPLIGGAIAAGGAFLSGALAYGLCRLYGRPVAKRILKPADLDRGERLFASVGGWLVVLSRWLPILPEVIACMAGLVRMPAGSFFSALACGTLPLGFLFATVGHAGAEEPGLAVGLSAIWPLVLWLVVRRRLARRDERSQPRPPSTTSPPRPSSAEPKLPRQ